MIVILDSTEICANFYLESPAFKLLCDAARSAGVTVVVPQVVFDEVVNKFREQIEEASTKVQGSLRRLKQLLSTRTMDLPIVDSAAAAATYANKLRTRLNQFHAEVPAYPIIAHSDVVERALRRRRPFRENGSGYRDFLIWTNVLSYATVRSSVAFVSSNKRDFGDDESGKLHPHLLEDVLRTGLEAGAIAYFTTLHQFVESHVTPLFEELKEVREALERVSYKGFNIPGWLRSPEGLAALAAAEWEPHYLDLDDDIIGVVPVHVSEVERFHVIKVRRLSDGELFIYFEAEFLCEFEITVTDGTSTSMAKAVARRDTLRSGVGMTLTFDPANEVVMSAQIASWFG